MSSPDFIIALQDSSIASAIQGAEAGTEWLFPIIETLHVFSLALVFGSIAMVDLRLLGISFRKTRVSNLHHEVIPWTWVSFLVAAITGTLLFVSKADSYWNNFEARAKLLFMVLAGINMLVFQFGVYRRIATWDNILPTPTAARVAGALSLAFWVAVVFFGRWIGFTT